MAETNKLCIEEIIKAPIPIPIAIGTGAFLLCPILIVISR